MTMNEKMLALARKYETVSLRCDDHGSVWAYFAMNGNDRVVYSSTATTPARVISLAYEDAFRETEGEL